MKRTIFCIMFLVCFISVLFVGCGGGGGGTKIDGFRFYKTDSRGLVMGEIKFVTGNSSVVYADSVISLSQCELFVPFAGGSMTMGIIAEYWDNGSKVDTQIDMTQDFSNSSENECFAFGSILPQAGGGTQANVTGLSPGKSRLVASCNGESAAIPIYTFDVITNIPVNSGLKIDSNGVKSISSNLAECVIGRNATGYYVVSEYCYKMALEANLTNLANVKTVNSDLLVHRTANILTGMTMYIWQAPTGYVKAMCDNQTFFFEYSSTINFK